MKYVGCSTRLFMKYSDGIQKNSSEKRYSLYENKKISEMPKQRTCELFKIIEA